MIGFVQTTSESKAHLFSFMLPGAEGELAVLYNRVLKAMTDINQKKKSVKSLKQIAETW